MSLLKDRELDTYVDVPRKSLGHFLIFLHVVGKQSKTCPRLGTYLAPMSQKCSCFAVAIVAPLLEVLVVTNASEGRQENNVDKARRDGEAKRVMAADAHLMVVELLKVNKQTYEYGKKTRASPTMHRARSKRSIERSYLCGSCWQTRGGGGFKESDTRW